MMLYIQLLIAALVLGGVYALIALGLNLVYGTTRLLNVAHGELLMIGAYIAYWSFASHNISPPLALPLAALAGALIGLLLYFTLLRALVRASASSEGLEISSLLFFFGLIMIFQHGAASLWSSQPRAYAYLDQSLNVFGFTIAANRALAAAVAIGLCLLIFLGLKYLRIGRAVRAVVQDASGAALVGINRDLIYALAIGLGFALTAIGGVLISTFQQITPFIGLHFTVIAFLVLILGGAGNFAGTLIAGFLVAILETFGAQLTSPSFKSIIAYGAFVLILMARPGGLFGQGLGIRDDSPASAGTPFNKEDAGPIIALNPASTLGLAVLVIGVLYAAPTYLSSYQLSTALDILKWVALAVSWYVFSGLTGYPSLAHGAFFGVGAFLAAVLWPDMQSLIPIALFGALAAGCFALIIGLPVLRVKGPYFVVLTLGINLLALHAANYYDVVVQGNVGHLLLRTPDLSLVYKVTLLLAAAVLAITWWVTKSRFGRGLVAIRENEKAAQAVGINVGHYKWLAFSLSAALAGAVGSTAAVRWTYVDPGTAFNLEPSFMVMIQTVLGGSTALTGPVVGAVVLTFVSNMLRTVMPHGYLILLGALLIVVIIYAPGGLSSILQRIAGNRRRWRARRAMERGVHNA